MRLLVKRVSSKTATQPHDSPPPPYEASSPLKEAFPFPAQFIEPRNAYLHVANLFSHMIHHVLITGLGRRAYWQNKAWQELERLESNHASGLRMANILWNDVLGRALIIYSIFLI